MQQHKLGRGLKFRIYKLDVLYHPGSEQQRCWSDCTGWSAPLLFAYGINRFSHDLAHIKQDILKHAPWNLKHSRHPKNWCKSCNYPTIGKIWFQHRVMHPSCKWNGNQYRPWSGSTPGLSLERDLGEKVSLILLLFPYSELRKTLKYIEHTGKSKIRTKTSPWMPLNISLSVSSRLSPATLFAKTCLSENLDSCSTNSATKISKINYTSKQFFVHAFKIIFLINCLKEEDFQEVIKLELSVDLTIAPLQCYLRRKTN